MTRALHGTGALLLLIAATAGAVAAAAPPRVVHAEYDVSRNGLRIAAIQEHYDAGNGAYRLVSESRAVGVFVLAQRNSARFVSTGQVTREGLRPERFEAGRGDQDPRRVSAEFDWAAARVTLRHDGRTDIVELPAGTQDRLSVMYQFMFAAPDRQRIFAFPMTNGRKLDRYRYTITPDVEIDTPLGRLQTLHLVKQREPGDTGTEIWLSVRHHLLPVKMIVIEDDGARYEQVATRLQVDP